MNQVFTSSPASLLTERKYVFYDMGLCLFYAIYTRERIVVMEWWHDDGWSHEKHNARVV